MYIIAEKTSYRLSLFKTDNFHKALNCVMNLNAKRQSFNGFYFFYKTDKIPNTLLFEL